MKDSDKTTCQSQSDEHKKPKQTAESEKQVANMNYSEFVSLLEESRII